MDDATTTTTTAPVDNLAPSRVSIKLAVPPRLLKTRTKLEQQATTAAVIDTPASYVRAVETLKILKAEDRKWSESFREARAPLLEARNRSLALEQAALGPLREKIATLSAAILAWRQEDAARKKAEEARLRQEAEEKARLERAQQLTAMEAAAKAADSRADKRALTLQAAQLKAAPIVAVQPRAVVTTVPKVAGIVETTRWEAEVVDKPALVAAAGAGVMRLVLAAQDLPDGQRETIDAFLAQFGLADLDLLDPNGPALNRLAVQCQGDLPVPGVRGVRRSGLAIRG